MPDEEAARGELEPDIGSYRYSKGAGLTPGPRPGLQARGGENPEIQYEAELQCPTNTM